jgi:hypothetical protein
MDAATVIAFILELVADSVGSVRAQSRVEHVGGERR